jgi:RNA polymerase sigma-70 factor (ECF subfamily)
MCGERREDRTETSESDLIRAAQVGDRLAYDELVRRHQRSVYHWAYNVVRSHDAADEVAQEVFVRTYMALDRIDPERPLGSWLCRTTVNVALNTVRKQRFRTQWAEENKPDPASLESPGDQPDAACRRHELIRRLERGINGLPPLYRTVLLLRARDQMTYEEIARTLDVSVGTVMSRLARARKRLRNELGDILSDGS